MIAKQALCLYYSASDFIRQLGGDGNFLCYDAIFLFPTVVISIAEMEILRAVVSIKMRSFLIAFFIFNSQIIPLFLPLSPQ